MRKRIFRGSIIGAAIFLLLGVWWEWQTFMEKWVRVPADVAARGQFGDSYGSLNALITGLALIGVAYTLFLQIADADQREQEAKNTERARKVEALERDAQRHEDSFEDKFFRLLDIWRSYLSSLESIEKVDDTAYISKGAAVLKRLWDSTSEIEPALSSSELEHFVLRYKRIMDERGDMLTSYYRTLYHTFRYIERSKVSDKEAYSDIVRAILSPTELTLLALNCMTKEGVKFRQLVEEFHLLKHLPEKLKTLICDGKRINISAFRDKPTTANAGGRVESMGN